MGKPRFCKVYQNGPYVSRVPESLITIGNSRDTRCRQFIFGVIPDSRKLPTILKPDHKPCGWKYFVFRFSSILRHYKVFDVVLQLVCRYEFVESHSVDPLRCRLRFKLYNGI